MRIYKSCTFFVGTKVPFDKLPGVIEDYLQRSGLTYKHFLYQFSELDLTENYKAMLEKCDGSLDPDRYRAEATAYLTKVSGCRKAQAEHPELGAVRTYSDPKRFDKRYLSNLDDPSHEARGAVVPLMTKIYRRYGIDDVMIAYQGIDFFGSDCPCGVSHENGYLKKLTGARIVLKRTGVFPKDTYIAIHFDITDTADDNAADAYRDAMLEMLPEKVRFEESTYCSPSDEEEAYYRELEEGAKSAAAQIAEAIREAAREKTDSVGGVPGDKAISLAPALKKAAKAYGYKYVKPYYRFYGVVKETPCRHILYAEMETGHCGNEFNVYLDLLGAGFRVRIAPLSFAPSGRDETDKAVFAFFEAVKSVGDTLLAGLDSYFPESPEKYIKSIMNNSGSLNLA